jgi:ParB family transcriptional regulator, chromosome partitioning protein
MGKFSSIKTLMSSESVTVQEALQPSKDALTVEIPLSKVFISPLQYRHYIDSQELQALADSIAQHGLLEAIVVRRSSQSAPTEDKTYELAAGQKRYRACLLLERKTIEAKILELSDDALVEIGLIENNRRSAPNVLEETQGILTLLQLKLNYSKQEEVIALLNRAAHEKKQGTDSVIRSADWKIVESVFQSVSTLSPEGFRVNRLPLLNLPKDILEALHQGKLEYTKAKLVAQIEDPEYRSKILWSAIEEGISLRELREQIRSIHRLAQLRSNEFGSEEPTQKLYERFQQATTRFKKAKLSLDQRKRAEQLLSQLLSLIDEAEK